MDNLKVKDKVIIKRYRTPVEGVVRHICQYDLRPDCILVEHKDGNGKQEWYAPYELEVLNGR